VHSQPLWAGAASWGYRPPPPRTATAHRALFREAQGARARPQGAISLLAGRSGSSVRWSARGRPVGNLTAAQARAPPPARARPARRNLIPNPPVGAAPRLIAGSQSSGGDGTDARAFGLTERIQGHSRGVPHGSHMDCRTLQGELGVQRNGVIWSRAPRPPPCLTRSRSGGPKPWFVVSIMRVLCLNQPIGPQRSAHSQRSAARPST